jgi:signal transduction histidine kinase
VSLRVVSAVARRWAATRAFVTRVSPRARDVLAVLASLAATLGVGASRYHDHGLSTWLLVSVGVSLVATAALWGRRALPVVVTLIAMVGAAVSAVPVALVVAVMTLAIRRRDRVLALVVAVTYVGDVTHTAVTGGNVAAGILSSALVWAAVVAFGAYVGARRDLIESLRQRAETAEAERELRVDQARLGERTRIAGEMHDVLAHKVSLIALHAGGLEVNPDAGPEQVERTAALVRTTAREALEDLRRVLGVLRTDGSLASSDLVPQPRLSDVDQLIEASRAAGVVIRYEREVIGTPPDDVSRTAHRIVQESLTNVHKHARSAATDVRLTGAAGRGLDVEVRNRVPVAAASLLPGSGLGLVGLGERVALVGGELHAGPTPDGGWCVRAQLPWPQTQEVA